MSVYQQHCLPHLLHLAYSSKAIQAQRRKLVSRARGRVLEVGFGSGLNLPYYDPAKVDFIWALEPLPSMRAKAKESLEQTPIEVRWLELPCEQMPLEDNSVDTIVLTYTLCAIDNWEWALEEMRRVLKPGGHLLFCEQGQAPDQRMRQYQGYINGLWKKVTGGCHLDRPIPEYLKQGGFTIKALVADYIASPKVANYTYLGVAT